MYIRALKNTIKNWVNDQLIIILYGARQTGKTTLLEQLFSNNKEALLLNCEIKTIADILESKDMGQIRALFGTYKIIVLDEAQKIKDIGLILKLIYDDNTFDVKLIATGSSSFELARNITEPLTGRNVKFKLFPLTIKEMRDKHDWLWVLQELNQLLIFGSYPGIVDLDHEKKKKKLFELTSDYLYQDILSFQDVRNPELLRKLLKALALQVGSQVSLHELSNLLQVSSATVGRYIDLLEKNFVIFSLPSYSTNIRNEIKKSKKYFFYDNGIRNAIIGDFTPLTNRRDIGQLWENFCINEIIKNSEYSTELANFYFWRTYDGAEIDLIKQKDAKLFIYEFKWNPNKKYNFPKSFLENYAVTETHIIHRDNLHQLLD